MEDASVAELINDPEAASRMVNVGGLAMTPSPLPAPSSTPEETAENKKKKALEEDGAKLQAMRKKQEERLSLRDASQRNRTAMAEARVAAKQALENKADPIETLTSIVETVHTISDPITGAAMGAMKGDEAETPQPLAGRNPTEKHQETPQEQQRQVASNMPLPQ